MRSSFFFFLLCSFAIQAQSRLISGTVIDAKTSEPLFGVNIFVKGTNRGTTTDLDGNFTYNLKGSDLNSSVLVFTSIGYKKLDVIIGDQNIFNVSLEEDVESLDAVVITSSYGTKKRKEEVVGSISSIKPTELAIEQPATSVDELLAGQVAGVFIETNPNLGEPVSINIRGQGSLTPLNGSNLGTSTQPLIIVDGIILSEELGIQGSNFFDGNGDLDENFLNPLARVGIQDIESIEVLKDAAAVGLYGANAANGVILITTKGGRKGQIQFNASVQAGYSEAFDGIKYMNGEQYNELNNIYQRNRGNFDNVQPWNGVSTDWFDLLNQNGSFTRYSVGANGGGELFRFRGSVTYQQREESQVSNSFDQLNTSLAANYEGKKLKVGLKLSPSFITKNNPNSLYNFAVNPTIPVRDEDGDFTFFANFGNPLAVAQQNKSLAETFAILSVVNLSYDFSDKLKLNTLYGTDLSYKNEDRFFSALNGTGQFNGGDLGRRILRERNTSNWNWNASLSYNNSIKKHHFDGIIGVETRGEKAEFRFARGQNLENPEFLTPRTIAEETDFQSDTSESYGRSGFSQVNYDYDKTYFFLANFRIDQSSAFGGDNSTAINAGAGASWVLSKERFLDSVSFIDFLRLRTSYGTTGNSRIGSYAALGIYERREDEGYNGIFYATPSGTAPNPNLGWEKNNKFNIGLDLNIFQKVKMTLEVFRDQRSDMIVSRSVIPESGYANAQINGSEMINEGIEYSLNVDWLSKSEFKWSTSFNIATLRNEVTSLKGLGSEFSGSEVARSQQVGFATSTIWGFPSLGIDPATGRELFNVNGQVFDSAYVRSELDTDSWVPIGDSQPDFYGGLRNTFSYKGINLNVITSFTYGGQQLVDRTLIDNYNSLQFRNLNVNAYYDSWRQSGDVASYPAITDFVSVANSSRYIYDTSRFELKSVSLSYNIPVGQWKIPLKTLSVNANGSNLYIWYKDRSESGRNGIAEFRNIYPQMRTFSLGLNTTF
ncbi:MAG: SusC/RagA family TonB-linked outer membrane protein [Nonlabens sp.]